MSVSILEKLASSQMRPDTAGVAFPRDQLVTLAAAFPAALARLAYLSLSGLDLEEIKCKYSKLP